MESRSPDTWDCREVSEWLSSIGLGQYAEQFTNMKIDGMLLFEMTDTDLKDDLGVPVRLHRFKILESVKKLKETPTQQQGQPELEQISWEILALKAVEGQLANNTFLIGTSGATIGRNSSSSDIVISESFVSRRHCEVKYNDSSSQFFIVDVGSTTGTFLMVREPTKLYKEMVFQMGLSEFKVSNVKYNPFGKAVELELYIFEGPARSRTITVDTEGLTIGRDPENLFCIREDSQMSSFHSKINYADGQFTLIDVGSTNRTWIRLSEESEKSQPFQLLVGDTVKVGSTVLIVELPDSGAGMSFKGNSNVSEEHSCKICYMRETDTACYPCGHVLCQYCAVKCNQCPNCRQPIQELVRLFR